MATVTWDAPKTRAMVEEYQVVSGDTGAEITITGTMATVSKLTALGATTFTVNVLYKGGTAFVPGSAESDADNPIVG